MDGLFLDDFWCSNAINGTCTDPVQGATEIDANQQVDMGLSDEGKSEGEGLETVILILTNPDPNPDPDPESDP